MFWMSMMSMSLLTNHRSHVCWNGQTFFRTRGNIVPKACALWGRWLHLTKLTRWFQTSDVSWLFVFFVTSVFQKTCISNIYIYLFFLSIHTDSDIKLGIGHNWSYQKKKTGSSLWIHFFHCTNGTWKGSPNGINHWRPPLPQFGKGMPFMESPKLTNLPTENGQRIPKGTGLDPSKPSIFKGEKPLVSGRVMPGRFLIISYCADLQNNGFQQECTAAVTMKHFCKENTP